MAYTLNPMRTAAAPRASKKKAKLVEAAAELFKRYGIKRVSVTEVCEAAEVSKVTFYKFFSNKVDLAQRVIEVLTERIQARIGEIAALDMPLPEKVAMLVEERVRRAREWSPEFIDELYHLDPALGELVLESARRTRMLYIDFIRRAQAAGEMRPEVHPEVALAVLDKLYDLGGDDALVQRAGGFERLTRDVNNLFFYGMLRRTEAGKSGARGGG